MRIGKATAPRVSQLLVAEKIVANSNHATESSEEMHDSPPPGSPTTFENQRLVRLLPSLFESTKPLRIPAH